MQTITRLWYANQATKKLNAKIAPVQVDITYKCDHSYKFTEYLSTFKAF